MASDVNDELEFRNNIRQMKSRELAEFTALQTYDLNIVSRSNGKRITKLELRDRRWVGIGGGIGAVVSAALYAIISYFR